MQTCEGCYWMRGKIRLLKGRFDYRGYSCSCSKGILWNEFRKEPMQFQLGTRASLKNYVYERWRVQAVRCMDFDSMD